MSFPESSGVPEPSERGDGAAMCPCTAADTTAQRAAGPWSLIRVSAIFASGNLLATAFRLVGGVLTSRLVDPSVLGLFNGIGLVRGYAPFLQGGVANGLNRELPFLVGKGEKERARELAAVAQSWLLLVAFLGVAALIGMAAWELAQGHWQLALGWASFTVPVFGVLYGQFYLRILYVTHGRFPRLSYITVLVSAVGVVTVAFVWWLGFAGLCLRGVIVAALMLGLLWRWRPLSVRPRWRWPDLRLLVKTGVPIFAVGQLAAWWPVLDSTLVLKYAGTRGLGLYALATMAGPVVALLPQAMGQVVYPKMAEEYGRTGCVRPLVRMAVAPTVVTIIATLAAVVVGWFLIPPVTRLLLPKYIEGIPAAQWSLVATAVMALTPVNNVFNVVKKQGQYGVVIAVGMLAYYSALRWIIQGGVSLVAFPQALFIGRLAFVIGCYGLIFVLVFGDRGLRNGESPE